MSKLKLVRDFIRDKRKDIKEVNEALSIEFEKIKQHVGEVSIQHFKK
jgi:hypothetical protein